MWEVQVRKIRQKLIVVSVAAASALGAGSGSAATLPLYESELDDIFSQASIQQAVSDLYGVYAGIDIRYTDVTTVDTSQIALLDTDIDTELESNLLLNQRRNSGISLNMYFADSITFCGTENANGVGCGVVGGNGVILDRDYVAGPNGAEVLAHEIAHNLGLEHTHDGDGLMGSIVNQDTSLSAIESGSLVLSEFIQGDADTGFFIEINPINLVVAPLPAAGLMLAGALAMTVAVRQRRRRT